MRLYEENKKSRVLKTLQKEMERDARLCIERFEMMLEDLDHYSKNDHLIRQAEHFGRGFALDVILFRCIMEAVEETDRSNPKKILNLALKKADEASHLMSREESSALMRGVSNLYEEFIEK